MATLSPYVPSKHQAAGHDGCLTLEDGSLFIKLTNSQEIDFYAKTQADDSDGNERIPGTKLVDWMPLFMGTLSETDVNSVAAPGHIHGPSQPTDKQYVVLGNCYSGYAHPSILDIKLGAKLTDDEVTAPEKIERLQKVSESTTSGSHNFRICGMKVYNGESVDKPNELYEKMNDSSVSINSSGEKDNYLEFNKFYGRSLDSKNIKDGIRLFFTHHLKKVPNGQEIVIRLLDRFHKRLQLLYNCLLDYEVRIFSGSLLFIYENDLQKWQTALADEEEYYQTYDPLIRECNLADDDEEEEEEEAPVSSLNIIDFAHAKYVPGQGHDENILQGIENLIDIFDQLLKEEESI
ncbi:uncharacterized protein SPAPADRAFT_137738 [Spathaspora passalidarum NRRL Y-27907]|uniref:Kinase n=1 Tax=Spathaspora passalidarum (strain NRRL Y-27907 / 11-Y1) TaxID=619300 RepID=G3AMG5_SPAPN|nr:uncharacterized protein SPAPADRAFT_137738 [Spathaspora passalidarum NRRL Y-27907]EGW32817.1 hypothetical protein SPAPADRAFT_137738 [Spathaspora passalidarum NRRL Y-27907]